MLTKLTVENFKRFERFEIELGSSVLFVGPNNSGKTSALQALALWEAGLKAWYVKRGKSSKSKKRTGTALNRKDILAIPVPELRLLWEGLHVRDFKKIRGKGRLNICIRITVEGIDDSGEPWSCGMEFDYANSESLYCRPLESAKQKENQPEVPPAALNVNTAFLPPMSGLIANEVRIESGAVDVRIGEGRTAETLRNICYQISKDSPESWNKIVAKIKEMFGASLNLPEYITQRGEIAMTYKERQDPKIELDLSSAGRGMLQTLLILGHMHSKPGSVLLFDEPDAHLEILRQREIYQLIAETARETGGQFIAASHSEVLLKESAQREDTLVFFIGKEPKPVDNTAQVIKSLKEYGFEEYYKAEQVGWILYLEGPTDLSILRAFAEKLNYEKAIQALASPFFYSLNSNQPGLAKKHFYAMDQACGKDRKKLRAIALFDRLPKGKLLSSSEKIRYIQWRQREIENYLCFRETLMNWIETMEIEDKIPPLLVGTPTREIKEKIAEIEKRLKSKKQSPWGKNIKASTDFLIPLFNSLSFSKKLSKANFYQLVKHVPDELLDKDEVTEKLDAIVEVYESRNDPEA